MAGAFLNERIGIFYGFERIVGEAKRRPGPG